MNVFETRDMTMNQVREYVVEIARTLEWRWLHELVQIAHAFRECQDVYTPEFYRIEALRKEEEHKAVWKALERPGYILVAWFDDSASSVGWGPDCPRISAFWLPETGPRRVFSGHGSKNEVATLKMYYAGWKRESYNSHFQSLINDDPKLEYELIATHLLDKGPDRRAAYLERVARA